MLNDLELKEVTELASVLMTVDDIAIIIGKNPVALRMLISDECSAEYKAFKTGQLKIKAELHKVQISLAKSGSQAAATLVEKLKVAQINSEL